MRYIFRVLGYPFFLGILTIWLIRMILLQSFNWMRFGGESLAYTAKHNPKTIFEVYTRIDAIAGGLEGYQKNDGRNDF